MESHARFISTRWQIMKTCMQKWGCQAVVAQTGFQCCDWLGLLEHGIWKGAGVLGPEAFDPLPFMEKMADMVSLRD